MTRFDGVEQVGADRRQTTHPESFFFVHTQLFHGYNDGSATAIQSCQSQLPPARDSEARPPRRRLFAAVLAMLMLPA